MVRRFVHNGVEVALFYDPRTQTIGRGGYTLTVDGPGLGRWIYRLGHHDRKRADVHFNLYRDFLYIGALTEQTIRAIDDADYRFWKKV